MTFAVNLFHEENAEVEYFFLIQNLFRKTNMLFDVNTVQIFLLVLVLPG
jgi:hypothetical protein